MTTMTLQEAAEQVTRAREEIRLATDADPHSAEALAAAPEAFERLRAGEMAGGNRVLRASERLRFRVRP